MDINNYLRRIWNDDRKMNGNASEISGNSSENLITVACLNL